MSRLRRIEETGEQGRRRGKRRGWRGPWLMEEYKGVDVVRECECEWLSASVSARVEEWNAIRRGSAYAGWGGEKL